MADSSGSEVAGRRFRKTAAGRPAPAAKRASRGQKRSVEAALKHALEYNESSSSDEGGAQRREAVKAAFAPTEADKKRRGVSSPTVPLSEIGCVGAADADVPAAAAPGAKGAAKGRRGGAASAAAAASAADDVAAAITLSRGPRGGAARGRPPASGAAAAAAALAEVRTPQRRKRDASAADDEAPDDDGEGAGLANAMQRLRAKKQKRDAVRQELTVSMAAKVLESHEGQVRKRDLRDLTRARVTAPKDEKGLEEGVSPESEIRFRLRNGPGGGAAAKKRQQQLEGESGTDEEALGEQATAWQQDLEARRDAGNEDLRTAFSLKECGPATIRKLGPESFLGGRRLDQGGMLLFDHEGKVNLHFLLGTFAAVRRIREKEREEADDDDRAEAPGGVSPLSFAQLRWLLKEARRHRLVDRREVKTGKVVARRMDGAKRSGDYSLCHEANLVDGSGDEGTRERGLHTGPDPVALDFAFPELQARKAVDVALEKSRLRRQVTQRQAAITAEASTEVSLEEVQAHILAPSLSFDWEDKDKDDEEAWGGLEVDMPEDMKKEQEFRRDFLKTQLKRSVSFQQAKSLTSAGRRMVQDSMSQQVKSKLKPKEPAVSQDSVIQTVWQDRPPRFDADDFAVPPAATEAAAAPAGQAAEGVVPAAPQDGPAATATAAAAADTAVDGRAATGAGADKEVANAMSSAAAADASLAPAVAEAPVAAEALAAATVQAPAVTQAGGPAETPAPAPADAPVTAAEAQAAEAPAPVEVPAPALAEAPGAAAGGGAVGDSQDWMTDLPPTAMWGGGGAAAAGARPVTAGAGVAAAAAPGGEAAAVPPRPPRPAHELADVEISPTVPFVARAAPAAAAGGEEISPTVPFVARDVPQAAGDAAADVEISPTMPFVAMHVPRNSADDAPVAGGAAAAAEVPPPPPPLAALPKGFDEISPTMPFVAAERPPATPHDAATTVAAVAGAAPPPAGAAAAAATAAEKPPAADAAAAAAAEEQPRRALRRSNQLVAEDIPAMPETEEDEDVEFFLAAGGRLGEGDGYGSGTDADERRMQKEREWLMHKRRTERREAVKQERQLEKIAKAERRRVARAQKLGATTMSSEDLARFEALVGSEAAAAAAAVAGGALGRKGSGLAKLAGAAEDDDDIFTGVQRFARPRSAIFGS